LLFWAVALLFSVGAVVLWLNQQEEPWAVLTTAYIGIEFWFFGYLLWLYDHRKHPTIDTFMESTLFIGTLMVPIFIPALLIGSIRCHFFLNSLKRIENG
ncbi:MAG: hypothetical protein AAF623_21425, partial [Planctomycetota bacterium]